MDPGLRRDDGQGERRRRSINATNLVIPPHESRYPRAHVIIRVPALSSVCPRRHPGEGRDPSLFAIAHASPLMSSTAKMDPGVRRDDGQGERR